MRRKKAKPTPWTSFGLRTTGGLNLFGRGFGNYPQDVDLRIEYDVADAEPTPGGEDASEPSVGATRLRPDQPAPYGAA